MSLDKDQVQHIAVLARLRVADEEIADTVDKLSRIVDFVDQLSQADTTDVVPMAMLPSGCVRTSSWKPTGAMKSRKMPRPCRTASISCPKSSNEQ